MGACTVTISDNYNVANKRRVVGTIALSSSYATGGDTFTLAQLGLSKLDRIQIEPGAGFVPAPIRSTLKVKAFWTGAGLSALLAEVTAATDLSATALDFVADGV